MKEVELKISNYLILFEGKELTRRQTIALITHIPLSGGKVCDECNGEKWVWVNHGSDGYSQDACSTCNGTGWEIPPVTIESWIEKYQEE